MVKKTRVRPEVESNLTFPVRTFIHVTEHNLRCFEAGEISTYTFLYRILSSYSILNEREKADIMRALKENAKKER